MGRYEPIVSTYTAFTTRYLLCIDVYVDDIKIKRAKKEKKKETDFFVKLFPPLTA